MKLSQIHNRHYFCSEPLEQIENYQQALAEGFKGWCIHHRREIQLDGTRMSVQELKDQDLYFHRPASELVFMRCEEHTSLHHKGITFSEEHCQKIAETKRGKHLSSEHRKKLSEAKRGENNPNFGKHHSEEHRQKIAEALSGEHHPLFGKHLSEETRHRLSEALKGKHRSAETRLKMSEAHKGKNNWTKDSHWWNNGISNKRSRECPGEGWTRGYFKFK